MKIENSYMAKNNLLIKAAQLYGFDTASVKEVPGHEGGRNLVFMIGTDSVLRVVSLTLIFVFRDKNIFSDNKTRK